MGLREQAESDAAAIVQSTTDFAEDITLIAPDGSTTAMTGLTGDISRAIDPESGALVKGRAVHVTLATRSLPAGERPFVNKDRTVKPWRVSFARIVGAVVTSYAVVGTDPDDSMGTLVLELGDYRALP